MLGSRGWCGVVGALVAFATCPPALAQTGPDIEWVAPADCGTEVTLVAEIERLLGRALDESAARLRVRVVITPATRWSMRLVITGADGVTGERQIEGDTCTEVAAAAAIVIALAIDPSAADRIAQTPPTAPPPPPAVATPPAVVGPPARPAARPAPVRTTRMIRPPPPRRRAAARVRRPAAAAAQAGPAAQRPPPRPARPSARSEARSEGAGDSAEGAGPTVHVSALAGAGLALGTVPALGAVAVVGGALSIGRFRAEASFSYTLPAEAAFEDGGSGGGRVDLLGAALDACGWWAVGVWEPRGCVGGELGSIRASAFGVTDPGEADTMWLAARLGGGLAWAPRAVPAFRLWVALSGIVPWTRPRFVVEGRGPVFRPAVVSGRGSIGVELRFR